MKIGKYYFLISFKALYFISVVFKCVWYSLLQVNQFLSRRVKLGRCTRSVETVWSLDDVHVDIVEVCNDCIRRIHLLRWSAICSRAARVLFHGWRCVSLLSIMMGMLTVLVWAIHLRVQRCWLIDTLFEFLSGQQVSQVGLLRKSTEDVNLTLLVYFHLINSLLQLT